jgi:hypothetical protein
MPIGVSVWRIDGAKAVPVARSALANEKLLEDILEADIDLLGLPNQMLVIGRQVVTPYAGRVDLLCVDADGTLYVVEVKKDRTPREVVAQAMDYGYWARDLDNDEIRSIFSHYQNGGDFDEAFRATFGLEPPETVNDAHKLVIVASALDAASERIVAYASSFGLPLNVVFFQAFEESGSQYLTRTWLIDPVEETAIRKASHAKKQQAPWNGLDWYVSFGDGDTRNWEDALRYGFVSAGGGRWYTGTLKKLPVGGRVFVNLPGRGYVGVGIITGQAVPIRDFNVTENGQTIPLIQAPHKAPNLANAAALGDEEAEWAVPVNWVKAASREDAIRFKGRYGNQNTATRLTDILTRETVLERLGISENDLDAATAIGASPG